MNRRALRRRLAQRPNAARFQELQRYLGLCDWTLARVRGSHYLFERSGEPAALVVAYRRPHLLAVYVREALKRTREEGDDG